MACLKGQNTSFVASKLGVLNKQQSCWIPDKMCILLDSANTAATTYLWSPLYLHCRVKRTSCREPSETVVCSTCHVCLLRCQDGVGNIGSGGCVPCSTMCRPGLTVCQTRIVLNLGSRLRTQIILTMVRPCNPDPPCRPPSAPRGGRRGGRGVLICRQDLGGLGWGVVFCVMY